MATNTDSRPHGNKEPVHMKGGAAHHTGLGPAQGKPDVSPGHAGGQFKKGQTTIKGQRKSGQPY